MKNQDEFSGAPCDECQGAGWVGEGWGSGDRKKCDRCGGTGEI